KNPQLRHCEVTPPVPYARVFATEDAMPNIRIVSARVLTALAVVLVIGGASARAATSDPSEKTPALLAGLKPPHDAGLKSPHESNARSKATVHAANHGKKHIKIA